MIYFKYKVCTYLNYILVMDKLNFFLGLYFITCFISNFSTDALFREKK